MKTCKCDECEKQIDELSQVFVCDNYDFGYPFIFCSTSCFEKFQKLRIYKTLADAMKEESWMGDYGDPQEASPVSDVGIRDMDSKPSFREIADAFKEKLESDLRSIHDLYHRA